MPTHTDTAKPKPQHADTPIIHSDQSSGQGEQGGPGQHG